MNGHHEVMSDFVFTGADGQSPSSLQLQGLPSPVFVETYPQPDYSDAAYHCIANDLFMATSGTDLATGLLPGISEKEILCSPPGDSTTQAKASGHWYEDSSHGHISALTPVSLTLTGTHPATAPLTSTTESGRAFTPPPSPRPPCPRFTPALSPAEYCRRQLLHQDFILRAFHHLTACQRHLDGQLVYLQRQHADFMRRQQRAELLGPHSPALCRQQQRAQARLTSQRRAYLRDLEKLVEMQGWLLHQFDLQSYMRAHVARYAAHGVAGDWEKQEAAASMQGGELELCRRYQDRTFS